MHSHYHIPRLQTLPSLFAAHTATSIVSGMVGIFIPIYLLNLGYSLSAVLFIIAGIYFANIPFRIFGPRALVRYGANKCMIAGMISGMFFLLLLAGAKTTPWLLAPAAVASGAQSLYWLGFHTTFSELITTHRVGRVVGAASIITLASTSLSPALGGVIAGVFGPPALYVAAAVLLATAVVFLLGAKNKVHPRTFDWHRLPIRKLWRDFLASSSDGVVVNDIEGVVWPLFVFLLIPSYVGVGALSAVIVLTSALVTLYVAHREETKGELRYLRTGVGIYSLTNILRTIASSTLGIFGVNFLVGAGRSFIDVAYSSRYYENSRRHAPVEYIVAMELWLSVMIFLVAAALGVLALFVPAKVALLIGLGLAIPFSFGITRVR